MIVRRTLPVLLRCSSKAIINNQLVTKSIIQPILATQSARLYHQNVIDHYENPRNVGSLDKTRDDVGTGLVGM